MEETTNTMETVDNQTDAFLEGFDGGSPATEPETTQEEVAGEVEAEDTGSTTEAEGDTEKEVAVQEEADAEKSEPVSTEWNIRLNKQSRVIKAEEITPELLQKGFDYDRVRAKYDEFKPVMRMMNEFAQASGMSVLEYAKYLRTEAKKASGMDEAEAKRTIDLEDREIAVSEKEAAENEEKQNKEAHESRVQADIAEFAKAFPEIYEQAKKDKNAIPASVWAEVNGGMSLVSAYARYAVSAANKAAGTAKTKADAAAKNTANASRATGSMKSAGKDVKAKDDFLSGYGD